MPIAAWSRSKSNGAFPGRGNCWHLTKPVSLKPRGGLATRALRISLLRSGQGRARALPSSGGKRPETSRHSRRPRSARPFAEAAKSVVIASSGERPESAIRAPSGFKFAAHFFAPLSIHCQAPTSPIPHPREQEYALPSNSSTSWEKRRSQAPFAPPIRRSEGHRRRHPAVDKNTTQTA